MPKTRVAITAGRSFATGVVLAVASSWLAEFLSTGNPPLSSGTKFEPVRLPPLTQWPMPAVVAWPSDGMMTPVATGPPSAVTGVPVEVSRPPDAPSPESVWRWWVVDGVELRVMLAYSNGEMFEMKEIRSGWPVQCLRRCLVHRSNALSSRTPQSGRPFSLVYGGIDLLGNEQKQKPRETSRGHAYFPILPLWGGLALNAAFYGSIAWLVPMGFVSARRWVRRRRGLCESCGYPQSKSSVCTECGKPRGPA